jgi:threonylcarbamoyladenosine tRNA methylthiotransferase MtaB
VVGNAAKFRLPDLVSRRNGRPLIVREPLPTVFEDGPPLAASLGRSESKGATSPGHSESKGATSLGGRTRAFLKIQDGCDHACGYCAVRLARGVSRSRSWESIEREARAAIAAGYREIVLTGVNLGSYGRDLAEDIDLAAVMDRLVSLSGIGRLRLSSVEPHEVTDRLIHLVAAHANVCRHLHLPLQSGSQGVLRRMNRTYSPGQYASLVRTAVERIPDCGVGADVMVGFPGETAADFRETVQLLNDLPMTYLHVFSYSPRPRTPAARLDGTVAPSEKKIRSLELRTLGRKLSNRFCEGLVGRTFSVLFETRDRDGRFSGLTDNYVRVRAEAEADLTNCFADVRITGALGDGVEGTVVRASEEGEAVA